MTSDSDPRQVGDEAVLLAERAACPMVIGKDRVAAVKALLAATPCNVVISDDGLQHYRLGRAVEIAIVDGKRRFGNRCLLPAGPLREPVTRLQTVDFVIAQQEALPGEYKMTLVGQDLWRVNAPGVIKPLQDFNQTTVHAVAAIGNPAPFFAVLRAAGLRVIEHVYRDHYLYAPRDLDFGDRLSIVMTEKDAVKCQGFADERFWYLPVVAEVDGAFAPALFKKLGVIPCVAPV